MSIRNYTTQTNSHKGYTIEELKRLFGAGKNITFESLEKLISECFNYELVSGKGIRILELKNNDYKSNTTKTYKIECVDESRTGSGSGGGYCDINADKGLTLDTQTPNTVIADLYNYDLDSSIEEEGVYPVGLSVHGKLIVDMNISDITVIATANSATAEYIDNDYPDHFNFVISLVGKRISVYKIETWIEENGTLLPSTKNVYDSSSNVVRELNHQKTYTLFKDCSGRMNPARPNDSIKRTGKIKVYCIKNGENLEKTEGADTIFTHIIYYGYTGRYMTERGSAEISDERRNNEPNVRTQPYFKIYSSDSSKYITEGTTKIRTGLSLQKDPNSSNYTLTVENTEKNSDYILGGEYTYTYLPQSKSFSLNELSNHQNEDVFICILIPVSMQRFIEIKSSIDGGDAYSCLESMIIENVDITDWSYYNDGIRCINGIRYVAYTLSNSFNTYVNNILRLDCVVSTL